VSGSKLDNSDNDVNEDDGLKMNKDNDAITPKASKNTKMNISIKREANARLSKTLPPSISNISLNRESK
jgi:hypothetical protein